MIRKGHDVSKLKKCSCSGTPEVLMDREDDYIIRCTECHEATCAFMGLDQASDAWNAGETIGRLDIIADDPKGNLSGDIRCILLDDYCSFVADVYELPDDYDKRRIITNENGAVRFTSAVIVYGDGRDPVMLQAYNTAVIETSVVRAFNREIFAIKIEPASGTIDPESAVHDEFGNITALRFLFGEEFLVFDARMGSIYAEDRQGGRIPVPIIFMQ